MKLFYIVITLRNRRELLVRYCMAVPETYGGVGEMGDASAACCAKSRISYITTPGMRVHMYIRTWLVVTDIPCCETHTFNIRKARHNNALLSEDQL